MITPNSKIILLKTPIEIDENNQLTFSNTTAQYNYFHGLPKIELDEATFVRKDNVIRFPTDEEQNGISYDDLLKYNYCMYQNTSYSNKWFYAFITNVEYISNGTTNITIKTDVYQTWCFNVTWKQSFISREHIAKSNDTPGYNTTPENLELGEYIQNSCDYKAYGDLRYIMLVTEWATDPNNKPLATNFGGIWQAGGAYIFETISEVASVLNAFAQAGKSDAVYALYMMPNFFINNTSGTAQYSGISSPQNETYTINKQTTLNGYTPTNKKLLTYPYNFISLSNNNGQIVVLKYEHFSTSNCQFNIKGVPVLGGSIKCNPKSYEGLTENEENGIIGGKYPTLNWSEDAYTNWLTQNSVNLGVGIASAGLQVIGGAGMLAIGGGVSGASNIASGALSIANEIGQIYAHSLTPNSARGNTNGGDINVCSNNNGFYFYHTSIKEEYARIIDNYFNMYGYKINRLKTPNLNNRSNWNYVKTINANITGDIPQEDMQEYKNLFNNGITLWHDSSHFLDYSQSNN